MLSRRSKLLLAIAGAIYACIFVYCFPAGIAVSVPYPGWGTVSDGCSRVDVYGLYAWVIPYPWRSKIVLKERQRGQAGAQTQTSNSLE
jgi:hypothetical protein